MVMLLDGRHLQFLVHKKIDPSSYIWALPKHIEFASVLASFYSSVSKFCSAISPFHPINFKPWHNDP